MLSMLETVYVDTIGNKSIVSIQPKPAFQSHIEIVTTRKGGILACGGGGQIKTVDKIARHTVSKTV